MKTISLKNVYNLKREEMKAVFAGSRELELSDGINCSGNCNVTLDGVLKKGSCKIAAGMGGQEYCYCDSGLGSC